MKVSKPIVLYLPKLLVEKLDYCLEKNKPKFSFRTMYFHYVIYYIIFNQSRYKKYDFVSINKQNLKTVTTYNIDRYITYLIKYEFIITDKKYQKGIKSLWYKLNDNKINDEVKQIIVPVNDRLFLNIKKYRYKINSNQSKKQPHLYLMYKHFNKIEYDFASAEKWINKNIFDKKKVYYLNSIERLKNPNLRYFKRNKTNNRLDTNLTNLSKSLRRFLVGDLINIDLTNSQPFLLSILINTIIYNNNTIKNNNINNHSTLCSAFSKKKLVETFGTKAIHDISKTRKNEKKSKNTSLSMFNLSTQKGTFYNDFKQQYGNIKRSDVKTIMFKVLFSENDIYQKEKEIFKNVYPYVYKIIEILKQKDSRQLPIYLQKIESYIFIDCIAKELVQQNIIPLTIHDSVIIEKHHQAKALEIMNKVFIEQIGITPTLKIEKL